MQRALSATGNNPQSVGGFTLIELVVVITIMAIVLLAGIFIVNDNSQAYLIRREAYRMHQLLDMAAEDAMLHDRQWGIITSPRSYTFVYFDVSTHQWVSSDYPIFVRYALPSSLSLTTFVSDNLEIPTASSDDASALQPSILLLSSGQTSIFSLTLHAENNNAPSYIVASDGRTGLTFSETANETKP